MDIDKKALAKALFFVGLGWLALIPLYLYLKAENLKNTLKGEKTKEKKG